MRDEFYVDVYDDEGSEYRRRQELLRRRELKRRRRLKRKIKRYARFFGAWAVVLSIVVLLIVGVVKLGGAIVHAVSDDSENVEMAEESVVKEETDHTVQPDEEAPEIMSYGDSVDPAVYEFAIPGEKGLVIVDAGHGGYDGGADGGGVCEKDINLDIAYWVKEELELRGYSVFMTRTDDNYVGLSKRASLANEHTDAVCLVSIHQNAVPDAEYNYIRGVEGWTHEREGCKELAEALAAGVAEMTGAENRGAAFRKALVVCRDTKMPAAIVECGYMTNSEDLRLLQETDYQVNVARGIANGIDSFVAGQTAAASAKDKPIIVKNP